MLQIQEPGVRNISTPHRLQCDNVWLAYYYRNSRWGYFNEIRHGQVSSNFSWQKNFLICIQISVQLVH